MTLLHALRRAFAAGVAEYRRVRWQQRRRAALQHNQEDF